MLKYPIPLNRPRLPWLVHLTRQGLDRTRRLRGKFWPLRRTRWVQSQSDTPPIIIYLPIHTKERPVVRPFS